MNNNNNKTMLQLVAQLYSDQLLTESQANTCITWHYSQIDKFRAQSFFQMQQSKLLVKKSVKKISFKNEHSQVQFEQIQCLYLVQQMTRECNMVKQEIAALQKGEKRIQLQIKLQNMQFEFSNTAFRIVEQFAQHGNQTVMQKEQQVYASSNSTSKHVEYANWLHDTANNMQHEYKQVCAQFPNLHTPCSLFQQLVPMMAYTNVLILVT